MIYIVKSKLLHPKQSLWEIWFFLVPSVRDVHVLFICISILCKPLCTTMGYDSDKRQLLGRVDDLSFLDYLCKFWFLLIEFQCSFSIYIFENTTILCLLLLYFHQDVIAVGTSFYCARFVFFHTHASLLTFFVYFFILFHSCCSHGRVFWKILVREFPIYNSHTEW